MPLHGEVSRKSLPMLCFHLQESKHCYKSSPSGVGQCPGCRRGWDGPGGPSSHSFNSYSQLLCSAGNQVQIISKAVQGRHLKMASILKNSIFQQFISIKYAQGSILVENGFCFANVMIHIMIICAFIQSQQKNNVILHIWPNTANQYRLNKKWDTEGFCFLVSFFFQFNL